MPMTPVIIPGVFDALKDAVKKWPIKDRVCVIMFDEMLRPNLQYDAKNDVVIGYSDDGTERTAGVANKAFVALLSGLSAFLGSTFGFRSGQNEVACRSHQKTVACLN